MVAPGSSFVLDVWAHLEEQRAQAAHARCYIEGLEVAKLHFVLTVGEATATPQALQAQQSRHRRAFASYASEDRHDVLSIIQGIQRGITGLDKFFAEASLRSGERWQERLRKEIDRRGIFDLFWSRAASRSEWVGKE